MEVWRLVAPVRAEIGYPRSPSLGEAIAADDVRAAHDFITRGQSPDAPIPVLDPALTGGEVMLVSPITWAVANGRRTMVLMLLGMGATLADERTSAIACLAEQRGFPQLSAELLRLTSAARTRDCPAPSDPPLAGFNAAPTGPPHVTR